MAIEWPDDDVRLECPRDNFGFTGRMCYGCDGFPVYGHYMRDDFDQPMRGNFVEHEGHRWWSTKRRARVVQGSIIDSVGSPKVMDVTGSDCSVGSSSNATTLVCGNIEFCANAINLIEPYVLASEPEGDNVAWYPDSGATHHISKVATSSNQ